METVTPGGDVDESVLLNHMFDLHARGTYIVQVSRTNPLDPAIILKSNTLAIKLNK